MDRCIKVVELPDFDDADRGLAKVACVGDLETATALLADGADVCAGDELGRTPLHIAASATWPKMVELLLANGADPRAVDNNNITPLHCACSQYVIVPANERNFPNPERPRAKCARLLLAAGADPNALDSHKDTPLDYTPYDMDLIDCLIAGGADINLGARYHMNNLTPPGKAQQFVDRGYDIKSDADADRGDSLLHITKVPATCRLLLELGADPNALNKFGDTPLHYVCATAMGFDPAHLEELARILVEHGANRSARNNDGQLPVELLPDVDDDASLNSLHEICTPVAKGAHA